MYKPISWQWSGFAFALLLCAPVAAQQRDVIAERLGLTRENGALPLWEKPTSRAVEDLSQYVRSSHEAIMLAGHPDKGYGTAFVVSREHRLLATNAHVADILHQAGSMMAIRNGTAEVYEVERAWYHPGVLRQKGQSISIRSQDPADGDVDGYSPDVALLRLKPGPTLPLELSLATPAEARDLFAQPVGMLGFPGYDTAAWPQLGQKAQATFHQGVVSRATDFNLDANVSPDELQLVQHTMSSWGGFSGSPIFLPNGHVVALHNMSRKVSRGGETRSIPHGVRIDCLWELIAYHNLDKDVPIPIDKSRIDFARFERPRPQDEKFRKAIELCGKAWVLVNDEKYIAAVGAAEEAIDLAPGLAIAYLRRSNAYNRYATENETTLSKSELNRYNRWSADDAKKAMQLDSTNVLYLIEYTTSAANLRNSEAGRRTDAADLREAMDRIISSASVSNTLKASAYFSRSVTQTSPQAVIDDCNNGLRLDPWSIIGYFNRHHGWNAQGNNSRARSDLVMVDKLKRAAVLNSNAWHMAVSADDAERDGKQAFKLASEAFDLTDGNHPGYVDTLAAAYAELGDFERAVEYARQAVDLYLKLGDTDGADETRRREKLFAARKTYRE